MQNNNFNVAKELDEVFAIMSSKNTGKPSEILHIYNSLQSKIEDIYKQGYMDAVEFKREIDNIRLN